MTFWDLVAKAWGGFLEWIRMGTGHVLNVIRGSLYLALLFKLVDLTPQEQIGVVGSIEMILQGIAFKTTVPTARLEEKKAQAFEQGVAAGVASTGTGSGRSV